MNILANIYTPFKGTSTRDTEVVLDLSQETNPFPARGRREPLSWRISPSPGPAAKQPQKPMAQERKASLSPRKRPRPHDEAEAAEQPTSTTADENPAPVDDKVDVVLSDIIKANKDVPEDEKSPPPAEPTPSKPKRQAVRPPATPSKKPQPTTDTTASDTDEEDPSFAFHDLVDHRYLPGPLPACQIQVVWATGERTWEPERALHRDAPRALLAYWRRLGPRRPDDPLRPGLYEIGAVRGHSRDRKRLLVDWVGYGPDDRTWEPVDVVKGAAPALLAEYWARFEERARKRGRKKRRVVK